MLKPFFIKKKNIDNRLVPAVTAADAGKVLGVTEDGKIAAVEAGGGELPDITPNDFKKILAVNSAGKLALSLWSSDLTFTSPDGAGNWECDKTYEQITTLITGSPIPLFFNISLVISNEGHEGMEPMQAGDVIGVRGVIVDNRLTGNSTVYFSVSSDIYASIDSTDLVSVNFA